MAFRRVGGRRSSTLVPDLAASRARADRRGPHLRLPAAPRAALLDGRAVHASDIRRGLERVLRVNGGHRRVLHRDPWRPALPADGARAATCPPASEVDDAAGTITFRLTAADPDFLYKLALPNAVAVAPGVRRRPARGRCPPPARTWSPGSARAGRCGSCATRASDPSTAGPTAMPTRSRSTAARRGNGRSTRSSRDARISSARTSACTPELRRRVDAIATRYAGQLHSTPSAGTNFAFLNTHTPPFDNLDARRAVNYAVDRSAFVAVYGGERYAQATCQFLPRELPRPPPLLPVHGARRRRPAVERPRPRARPAPDRPLAHPRDARHRGRADRSLPSSPGAPAHERCSTGWATGPRCACCPTDAYFAAIQDSRHRVQIGIYGWVPDYPAASSMLQPLRCDAFVPASPGLNNNLSEFCDRRADRLAQRASQLPAGDARADALWAAADKRITDQAAALPLLNPKSITFVSRRVGNFQYSQQWGVLYDQLWVR